MISIGIVSPDFGGTKEKMVDIQIKTQGLPNGVMTISVKGFLDAHTYHELERIIKNLFSRKAYRFIVDLSQVNYISSSGVEVFTEALNVAQKNNGNLVIVTPKPNVIFELLGLSNIFTITEDIKSALAAFRGY